MYFVCGIHGVGKTTFANKLGEGMGLRCYSASELIENKNHSDVVDKRVKSIEENQQKLLHAIQRMKNQGFVLDGHLCLIDNDGKVQRIDKNIFQQLGIDGIYIVIEKIENIYRNIKMRDHIAWDLKYIEEFQMQEIEYARELSKQLRVPLKIIYNDKEIDSFAIVSEQNILLPIKPIYANMILEKTKEYEYRKTLCKKEIKKIYLYATSPIKRIVGEVKVIDKIIMEKEKLWNMSKKESGISREFFDEYFKEQEYACAYRLKESRKYKTPIELKKIGIEYFPQSYIYIGDL